jgi:hypothetical protein
MRRTCSILLVVCVVFISGCATDSPPNSGPQLNETQTETNVIDREVIRINNCGGSRDAEQVAQRAIVIDIEGELAVAADIKMVEAQVRTKYSWLRVNDRSMKVSAAPGTNMEVILVWTEQRWLGTITIPSGPQGTYLVRAPLSVAQEAALNLGCSPAAVPSQAIPPQSDQQATPQSPAAPPSPTLAPPPVVIPTATQSPQVLATAAPPRPSPVPLTPVVYGVIGQGEGMTTEAPPGVCTLDFYVTGGQEKTFIFSTEGYVWVQNYNGTLSCWQQLPGLSDVGTDHPFASLAEVQRAGVVFSGNITPIDSNTLPR